MSRYRISVNSDHIKKGLPGWVLVEDTRDGSLTTYEQVYLPGPALITSGPRRRYGASVWIETDEIEPTTTPQDQPAAPPESAASP